MSASAAGTSTAGIDGWIARLRLIPDARRSFTVTRARAEREFGFDPPLLRELVARGMPSASADADDEPAFADTDLHYLGLRLGCATIYQGVLRRWAATLDASAARERTDVEIRCTPYAAAGTEVEVLVGRDRRMTARTGKRPGSIAFSASTNGRWPAFDPALEELLHDVGALDFCWIPESMQDDVAFVRATRLSNCAAAAHVLLAACAERGVEARHVYGLLLAPPYSTPHYWAELRAGETWVPADPLLLGLLAEHAGLDAAAWPPTRSPGAILLPLAERPTAIVRSATGPLQATYLTSVQDAP